MENNQTTPTDAAKRLYGVNTSWRLGTIVEHIVVKETEKTYSVKRDPSQRGATVVRKSTWKFTTCTFASRTTRRSHMSNNFTKRKSKATPPAL